MPQENVEIVREVMDLLSRSPADEDTISQIVRRFAPDVHGDGP
jgi:hypothetical protein